MPPRSRHGPRCAENRCCAACPADPMRPPLTARDRVSVCIELIPQSKHARDLRERRLLRIAYKHAANAEKSTFLSCFGDMLADLAEPALEGGRIIRRLAVNQRASLPQGLDALGLEFGGVPACELFPQAISGDALPLRGLEVGGHCLDERTRP